MVFRIAAVAIIDILVSLIDLLVTIVYKLNVVTFVPVTGEIFLTPTKG